MLNGKSVLAIIPAREGSRRVPLKNIALYRKKPLIQHAIDHATASKYIDEIIVLSDSQAILAYAKPPIKALIEPAHIADHHSTTEAAIAYTLYERQRFDMIPKLPDFFVLLQPTSPLRTSSDIDTCIERATAGQGQCISYNEYGKRNGAVYVSSSTKFLATLSLEDRLTGAEIYTMPNSRSLDIDYIQDLSEPLQTNATAPR